MKKEKLPKALYSGKLPIANIELECAVLDSEIRVISQMSVFKAFNRPQRGNRESDVYINEKNEQIIMPPFLASKTLFSLINPELLTQIKIIKYQDGNDEKIGYKAQILKEMCSLYLEARRLNKLTTKQLFLADQAEILLEAFASVGIDALIDEVTGYQYNRKHDALRILLHQYISDGLQKWLKRFPDAFFQQLDKLYDNKETKSQQRPRYYGKFINTYIYEKIEKGYAKRELDKKNIIDEGKKKARFHQWLTDFGQNQLQLQIGRVMGVMEISPNLRKFKENIARQQGLAIQEDLFDKD